MTNVNPHSACLALDVSPTNADQSVRRWKDKILELRLIAIPEFRKLSAANAEVM
jgi:hypothetical protein